MSEARLSVQMAARCLKGVQGEARYDKGARDGVGPDDAARFQWQLASVAASLRPHLSHSCMPYYGLAIIRDCLQRV
jgi:hypothetical protein